VRFRPTIAAAALIGGEALAACLVDLASPTDPAATDGGPTGDVDGGCGDLGVFAACPLHGCEGSGCEPEIAGSVDGGTFGALAVDRCDAFVASNKKVYRFDKLDPSGTDPQAVFIATANIKDIALDEDYVFLATDLGVHRIRRDFSGSATTLALANVDAIALDRDNVYWVVRGGGTIVPCLFSVSKQGSQRDPATLGEGGYCTGLARDGSSLFYLTGYPLHSVRQVEIDGGGAAELVSGNTVDGPVAIAADGAFVFWTQPSKHAVQSYDRASQTSGQPWPFIGGEEPFDIVIDRAPGPATVFVTNQGPGAAVLRLVQGSPSNDFPVASASDGGLPKRIGLDATEVYWTAGDGFLRRARRCPQ
jgi:hypothetical protein